MSGATNGVRITFVEPDGTHRVCTAQLGQNLMDVAIAGGVRGITGQCGGAINCATCLCDVPHDWLVQLPAQHPDEVELLSYVDEAATNSRLCCQVIASEEFEGLLVTVVASGVNAGMP